jgi:putative nucleotidyltransferase with HDIG domain
MADKHPSKEECMALLKEYQTPEHVIRHCLKVTETALKIAVALNEKGENLDLELIQGAGLIHDIARVEDKHWEIGADIAYQHGYDKESEIIRVHMHYICDPQKPSLNETDILCLADRMVKEDEYVGLERRMQYILDKFKENSEAVARISERIKDNKALIHRIEKAIGTSIDSLMV